MNFTLVTAVTPDYEDKLKETLRTWKFKPQFSKSEILIYTLGYKNPERDLSYFGKGIRLVPILDVYNLGKRYAIFNALVTQTHKYITTPYWIKIDSDVFFYDDKDIFDNDDLKFDLVSQPWRYTKPAFWIKDLNDWCDQRFISGKSPIETSQIIGKEIIGHKRIISFVCLHKTTFTKTCSELCNEIIPVASHDTFLWYMAERLPEFKWKTKNIRSRGVVVLTSLSSIKREIKKYFAFDDRFLNRKSSIILTRKSGFGFKYNLLNKVQLEITTDCQLKCFNCDRSCRQAPSKEKMSIDQIQKFIKESLDLKWNWKRIDIIGGEPTLHPDLLSIIESIKEYKDKNFNCLVRFSTNGVGPSITNILTKIPKWIKIRNSNKNNISNLFQAYNASPYDKGYKDPNYCDIPWRCGLGLTRYGYFLCGAGASLARVFGFDIGIKSLNQLTYSNLEKQFKVLCLHCGHSLMKENLTNEELMTETWKRKYQDYKDLKTSLLTLY